MHSVTTTCIQQQIKCLGKVMFISLLLNSNFRIQFLKNIHKLANCSWKYGAFMLHHLTTGAAPSVKRPSTSDLNVNDSSDKKSFSKWQLGGLEKWVCLQGEKQSKRFYFPMLEK